MGETGKTIFSLLFLWMATWIWAGYLSRYEYHTAADILGFFGYVLLGIVVLVMLGLAAQGITKLVLVFYKAVIR